MKTKTLIAALAIALFSTGISYAQATFSGDGIYTEAVSILIKP
ncbi:hypothetical protein R1T16_00385 [Flavobacterium sp. DG1-102-2]|nr:hypothetical protein [Flavobacterium sp. DG1-102-2]MDV6166861.1 hypothetical protein [Flavobacterium sp. DG1-102-2]